MKKISLKRASKRSETPTRITNETVAEHRERILAGGRRFKYPVQYARHKLVLNAIIIGFVVLVLALILLWQQFYLAQNTSDFFYRIARFVPIPVASVDGQPVRYSDYLLYYKGSAYYLTKSERVDFSTSDGKKQMELIKRRSIDNAEADAYAQKLARDKGIVVTNQEIDQLIKEYRKSYGNISQEVYDASAFNMLGWSPEEYRLVMTNKLLRSKVEYAIDRKADAVQKAVAAQLKKKKNAKFVDVVNAVTKTQPGAAEAGNSGGSVPHTNSDGGLSIAALKLQEGEVSPVIKSSTGDGYYFVRLLSKTSSQLSYEYIRVPLGALSDQLGALKKDNKISEYISIPVQDKVLTK